MPDWTSRRLPDIRYDQAAFKASHNSYERDERPVTTQFHWDSDDPHQGGCRGIELDIQQSRDFHELWSVNHTGGYEGAVDRQFGRYLELLDRESAARASHDVITVTIDLKSVHSPPASFGADLDAYIAAHLSPDRLYTPGALAEKFAKDRAANEPESWPKLRELKGRFVCCLSGKAGWKEQYRNRGGALCFTDRKANNPDDIGRISKGPVFYNLNWDIWTNGLRNGDARVVRKWKNALEKLFSSPRVACRAYGLNNSSTWREARTLGMNLLSTDKVRNHRWAKVGGAPFGKAKFVG